MTTNTRPEPALDGLLTCAECGGPMTLDYGPEPQYTCGPKPANGRSRCRTLSASRLRPRSRGEENPGGSTFSFQPSPVVALDHALHRFKGLSAVPTPRGQERGGIEVAPRFPGAD